MLLKEGDERMENNGLALLPSLGACVRRIQAAANPRNISIRHNLDLSTLNEIDEMARAQRMKASYERYFSTNLAAIQSILPAALPHLELLDWEARISMPPSMFNALACSSVQHLKLYRIAIDKEFKIKPPSALACRGWPLRSLHLELH